MTEDRQAILKRIEEIEQRRGLVSKNPWRAFRMTNEMTGAPMSAEEIGEYVKNSVIKSETESGSKDFLFISVEKEDGSGSADVCHIGNGPRGPANADFIQHAKDDVEWLVKQLMECLLAAH